LASRRWGAARPPAAEVDKNRSAAESMARLLAEPVRAKLGADGDWRRRGTPARKPLPFASPWVKIRKMTFVDSMISAKGHICATRIAAYVGRHRELRWISKQQEHGSSTMGAR
jgi:hypothetical protein